MDSRINGKLDMWWVPRLHACLKGTLPYWVSACPPHDLARALLYPMLYLALAALPHAGWSQLARASPAKQLPGNNRWVGKGLDLGGFQYVCAGRVRPNIQFPRDDTVLHVPSV